MLAKKQKRNHKKEALSAAHLARLARAREWLTRRHVRAVAIAVLAKPDPSEP
jgi:hypothetical protein